MVTTRSKENREVQIPFSTVFLAQKGDVEAMKILWDHCRPFAYWLAGKWAPYSNETTRWHEYGDLQQAGYLAFRKALEKWRPVEGVGFKRYFGHWLREYFRREIGVSNSRRKELLRETISLNQQTSETESGIEHSSEEWIDFEEDPKALEAFELIDDYDFRRVVREIVETLPDPERKVIKDFHFNGLMIKTIAEKLGVSPTSAGRYLDNGYKMLRKNKIIQVLYAEIRFPELNPYEKIFLRAFKIDRMSSPEWNYIAQEAFREDLAKIFCGEEVDAYA